MKTSTIPASLSMFYIKVKADRQLSEEILQVKLKQRSLFELFYICILL